jgi:hypothetical protein
MAMKLGVLDELSKKLGISDAVASGAGAVAGLIGAGVLTGIKWLVEWGRPTVSIATGAVDATLGGMIVYNKFVKKERIADPFVDAATTTFGFAELLVGLAGIIGGIGRLAGIQSLEVDRFIKRQTINAVIKAFEAGEALVSLPEKTIEVIGSALRS